MCKKIDRRVRKATMPKKRLMHKRKRTVNHDIRSLERKRAVKSESTETYKKGSKKMVRSM